MHTNARYFWSVLCMAKMAYKITLGMGQVFSCIHPIHYIVKQGCSKCNIGSESKSIFSRAPDYIIHPILINTHVLHSSLSVLKLDLEL